MDTEQLDDLKETVLKLAAITAQIDHRNTASAEYIAAAAQALDASARRFEAGANQFSDAVLQRIGERVQAVVASGSAAALDGFNEQLRNSTGRVEWATEALTAQRKLLNRSQRTLVWQGLAALTLGAVLAAGTAGYLVWQAAHLGGDRALTASLRQAVATGALARCNQNQLCARSATADRNGKHVHTRYVIVE